MSDKPICEDSALFKNWLEFEMEFELMILNEKTGFLVFAMTDSNKPVYFCIVQAIGVFCKQELTDLVRSSFRLSNKVRHI